MDRHRAEFETLPIATGAVALPEGEIWTPAGFA
jgi:hypothetical protein